MCLSNLQLIHSHLFSSTSCWAFPPAQHVEKNMFCHICILFVKCSSDTREDACNHTTDWYNFSIDMGFYSFLSTDFPSFSSDDFPFPSLVAFKFGAGEEVHSFSLWSSLPLPEALTPWWKPHESPLKHCPVACHCQQSSTFLSTLVLFSFRLRVTTPPWIISFRALRFRLLIFWS